MAGCPAQSYAKSDARPIDCRRLRHYDDCLIIAGKKATMWNSNNLVLLVTAQLIVGALVLVLSQSEDFALFGKFLVVAALMAVTAAGAMIVLFQRFLMHAFRSETNQ